MRTARLLLASVFVLASAACSSDPVAPDALRPQAERSTPPGPPSMSTGLFGSGSAIPDPAPPVPPLP